MADTVVDTIVKFWPLLAGLILLWARLEFAVRGNKQSVNALWATRKEDESRRAEQRREDREAARRDMDDVKQGITALQSSVDGLRSYLMEQRR